MPSADQWGKDFDRAPAWTTWKVVLIATVMVLAVVAIVGLATTGSVLFAGTKAKLTNHSRVEQKVYDPNNTIAQIAFFHDTCNTAASQVKIVANNEATYRADLKAAKFAKDPVRQAQAQGSLTTDQQDVTGAKNALQATVANYNSRSAQSTANVFKDNDLPSRLNVPDPIPAGFTINCG